MCCINDILKNVDLEDLLKVTAEPRKGKRKGGSNKGVKPALVKEKPLPPGQCSECSDSEDEPHDSAQRSSAPPRTQYNMKQCNMKQ